MTSSTSVVFSGQGNLVALQTLFEKMRKSQVKPTLDSYAAVLSCLGKMDLFDPQVARRTILDIEKLVRRPMLIDRRLTSSLRRASEWWTFSISNGSIICTRRIFSKC